MDNRGPSARAGWKPALPGTARGFLDGKFGNLRRPLLVYVVEQAATAGLYRCRLCTLRVRDLDRLVLREVAHGIDTGR